MVGTVKKHINENDVIVRYGGEEFLIILKNADVQTAYQTGIDILAEVNTLNFSFSGGLSEIMDKTLFELNVKRVDSLLYFAKNNGKNQIAIDF